MVRFGKQIVARVMLPLVIAALPLVLLFSSVRTLRELDEQRAIYLRHRVSLVVSRLESLDPAMDAEAIRERLGEDEPYLEDLRIFTHPDQPGGPDLAAIWQGQELFRTELTSTVFRAHVPFHSTGGLRIARIDLNPAAAEFLLLHGRHNVIVSSIGGLVLVLLSVYSLWAMRRAARLQVRQLELEHLAHIGKMSAVLAHEIRNPLGTIKGFVQLAGNASSSRSAGCSIVPSRKLSGWKIWSRISLPTGVRPSRNGKRCGGRRWPTSPKGTHAS